MHQQVMIDKELGIRVDKEHQKDVQEGVQRGKILRKQSTFLLLWNA